MIKLNLGQFFGLMKLDIKNPYCEHLPQRCEEGRRRSDAGNSRSRMDSDAGNSRSRMDSDAGNSRSRMDSCQILLASRTKRIARLVT